MGRVGLSGRLNDKSKLSVDDTTEYKSIKLAPSEKNFYQLSDKDCKERFEKKYLKK